MKGTPADMQHDPHYGDVVAEVHGRLLELASQAARPGSASCGSTPGSASARRSSTTWPCWATWASW